MSEKVVRYLKWQKEVVMGKVCGGEEHWRRGREIMRKERREERSMGRRKKERKQKRREKGWKEGKYK